MLMLNVKVEHEVYGIGEVLEERDNIISVKFNEEIGSKAFVYPDAFERFLRVMDPEVEKVILEELNSKKEKIRLELLAIKQEEAELEAKRIEAIPAKKRGTKVAKKAR